MKNRFLAIAVLGLAIVGSGFAQEKALKSAKKSLSREKYTEAATIIDQVVVNPETAGNLDAWTTRGRVYLAIAKNPLLMRDYPNAAELSLESFNKVLSIDPSSKNVILMRNDVLALADVFYNKAATQFGESDFKGAVTSFESAFGLYQMQGIYDTATAINIASSAFRASDMAKAEEYFSKVIADGYQKFDAYTSLAEVYIAEGKKSEAAQLVEKALALFPEQKDAYLSASTVYLRLEDNQKASAVLETALQKWSDDPSFQLYIGMAYERMGEYEKAEAAYKKALEINPDFHDATLNMAAYYVNTGVRIKEEADKLPFEETEKYDAMMAEAKVFFERALPYLEKLMVVQPDNLNVLYTLRDVYVQLGQMDKATEVRSKIETLENE